MADKKTGRLRSTSIGMIETAVELARKVSRPLTFFAAIGFSLIGIIPIVYWMTPNDAKLAIALTPAILGVALIVDILCVLIWAKAKLAQDPNAFKDES